MNNRIKSPPDALFRLATDRFTAPFWEAAANHRLAVARCGDCGHFRIPATPFCPACRERTIEWVTLSGRGIIYSYTIIRRAILPEMELHIPYAPAVVELPDARGARLITNIVGTTVGAIRIGLPVTVAFETLHDGTTVPRFTPAAP